MIEGAALQPGGADHQRLADESYWNGIYDRASQEHLPTGGRSGLRRRLSSLLPAAWVDVLRNGYAQHLIDTVAVAPAFPVRPDWRALEVGSAPGQYLVDLHDRFGYAPYGVEYTPAGVEANRRLFARHGIPADHVIHADFFSNEFRAAHRSQFDIVFSVGFIEHFDDVDDAVARHVELLREGGRLLIVIPNLRGLNRTLAGFFHPGLIDIHNTGVMDKKRFEALFAGLPLRPSFQGHLGVFSLRLLNTKPESRKRHLLPLAWRLGQIIDLGLLAGLRGRRPESRWLSPYLVFAGEKIADARDA